MTEDRREEGRQGEPRAELPSSHGSSDGARMERVGREIAGQNSTGRGSTGRDSAIQRLTSDQSPVMSPRCDARHPVTGDASDDTTSDDDIRQRTRLAVTVSRDDGDDVTGRSDARDGLHSKIDDGRCGDDNRLQSDVEDGRGSDATSLHCNIKDGRGGDDNHLHCDVEGGQSGEDTRLHCDVEGGQSGEDTRLHSDVKDGRSGDDNRRHHDVEDSRCGNDIRFHSDVEGGRCGDDNRLHRDVETRPCEVTSDDSSSSSRSDRKPIENEGDVEGEERMDSGTCVITSAEKTVEETGASEDSPGCSGVESTERNGRGGREGTGTAEADGVASGDDGRGSTIAHDTKMEEGETEETVACPSGSDCGAIVGASEDTCDARRTHGGTSSGTQVVETSSGDFSAENSAADLSTEPDSLKTNEGSLSTETGSLKTSEGSLSTDVGSLKTSEDDLRETASRDIETGTCRSRTGTRDSESAKCDSVTSTEDSGGDSENGADDLPSGGCDMETSADESKTRNAETVPVPSCGSNHEDPGKSEETTGATAVKMDREDDEGSRKTDAGCAAKVSRKERRRAEKKRKKVGGVLDTCDDGTSPVAMLDGSQSDCTVTTTAAESEEDEEESWDEKFAEDGEALDADLIHELVVAVGNVKVQKPKYDYYNYQPEDPDVDYDSYRHLIEIYDFASDFVTRDLIMAFKEFKDFDVKWVDDTHAIGIFASVVAARSALDHHSPFLKVRPLHLATKLTKQKARRSTEMLQPYKARPETTAAVARSLVARALGQRTVASREKCNEERRQLREAREIKRQTKQHVKDAWEGIVGRCAMDSPDS